MIVSDATTDVQAAIRAALVADAALLAIIGSDASGAKKVYSRPPQHVAMPYVIIGDASSLDDSTSDTYGQHIIFDIGCWDQSAVVQTPSSSNLRQMMARVIALFHMQPDASGQRVLWTVPARNLIVARVTGTPQIVLQPDGYSNHGIVTLDVYIGHDPKMAVVSTAAAKLAFNAAANSQLIPIIVGGF
jgi:hypothetical protein